MPTVLRVDGYRFFLGSVYNLFFEAKMKIIKPEMKKIEVHINHMG